MNGWNRIGVVVSVIWIIGAGVVQRNADVNRASMIGGLSFDTCYKRQTEKQIFDTALCSRAFDEAFEANLNGGWGNVAIIAVAPVIFGWLFAYVFVAVLSWVRRGFDTSA